MKMTPEEITILSEVRDTLWRVLMDKLSESLQRLLCTYDELGLWEHEARGELNILATDDEDKQRMYRRAMENALEELAKFDSEGAHRLMVRWMPYGLNAEDLVGFFAELMPTLEDAQRETVEEALQEARAAAQGVNTRVFGEIEIKKAVGQ